MEFLQTGAGIEDDHEAFALADECERFAVGRVVRMLLPWVNLGSQTRFR